MKHFNFLFLLSAIVILSSCNLYKKVYSENKFIQVKQGMFKPEVVHGVKGQYVILRVWNYSAQAVLFDLNISNEILPNGKIRYHGVITPSSYFDTEKYFIPDDTKFTGFNFELIKAEEVGRQFMSEVYGPDGSTIMVNRYGQ
jgi:hypothetical protein